MKTIKKLFSTVIVMVVAAGLLSANAFAATGTGSVTASALNMREGGSMDYNIIDVAPRGATVYVNYDDGTGWYQVSYNGRTGYMAAEYITFGTSTPQTYTETYTAPTGSGNGTILGWGVRFRSGPSLDSEVIGGFDTGDVVQVNGACGAWYEVVSNGQTGYVYGDYVMRSGSTVTYTVTAATITEDTVVYTEPTNVEDSTPDTIIEIADSASAQEAPAVSETTPAEESAAAQPVSPAYNASFGQQVVNTAMQYIGIPYVWAGTSPEEGFDCSGLVYYVYGQLGYSLNRVAQSMYYNGVDVPLDEIQPGDILLFGSSVYNIWHAAIYCGNDTFIHAPSSGYTVCTQSLSGSYGLRLVAARRIA